MHMAGIKGRKSTAKTAAAHTRQQPEINKTKKGSTANSFPRNSRKLDVNAAMDESRWSAA